MSKHFLQLWIFLQELDKVRPFGAARNGLVILLRTRTDIQQRTQVSRESNYPCFHSLWLRYNKHYVSTVNNNYVLLIIPIRADGPTQVSIVLFGLNLGKPSIRQRSLVCATHLHTCTCVHKRDNTILLVHVCVHEDNTILHVHVHKRDNTIIHVHAHKRDNTILHVHVCVHERDNTYLL